MHPRDVLMGGQAAAVTLPVCDHYSGVEARMRNSLRLQADLIRAKGTHVLDVTLDCEDGAPVGGETEHAALVTELLQGVDVMSPLKPRVGVRVHPVNHPCFEADVHTIVGQAARRLSYLMLPKVESVDDIQRAVEVVDAAGGPHLPLHVLVESPLAVHHAYALAAHPRVESLSFGLMDFVSAHAGAIPADGMGVQGQFMHPLVVRAKLAISSACHAYGKVPSHSVVTEFKDRAALRVAAQRACRELGYTRMWSIHPDQIEIILDAFSPLPHEIDQAAEIVLAAVAAQWAPVSYHGVLHDRASYRYFWQVLDAAHRTGCVLPAEVQSFFDIGV